MKTPEDIRQRKLIELTLYIADLSQNDPKFGLTKLCKLLFFSDFYAYRNLGEAITGVEYAKREHGPAPRVMQRILEGLEKAGEASLQRVPIPGEEKMAQRRLVPLRTPDLQLFTEQQRELVRQVVQEHRGHTAKTISQLSHEMPAWKRPRMNDVIPYEAIFWPDPTAPISEDVMKWAKGVAKRYEAKKKRKAKD